ncbi:MULTISPECIES: HlyD family type I secretion periplasmic adaptor subunit [Providencia]|uniref:Membrane fusion protein (MFP) family protein n=3 Tax=Providencia TaxID=586 RepID=A0AAP2JWX4_PRORE|nr:MULTISPECIES: HlyD family type I secretion periplasmic adaptor subunit [Providencia]EJD6509253.1 HlyD family type I secretion periplasmic adaptor subunit [Providencia rettgeri]ELR5134715.1 HlyD family type I secretion periplasmic adaptor subunit [Providencia rettgeri]ELR5138602.1 HlyD family type I secretion periplasmic adaptor subunit [Providencia rettgeri]ELR5169734.1 HlyD family type I secretion periplasmic adaptor subunit [Providencia rettgeri]ELR5201119.1 HlyD family type I secretion p
MRNVIFSIWRYFRVGFPIRKWLPFLFLVSLFGLLFLQLDIAIDAKGYLEVKNRNVVIEHASGGKVEQLLVQEGSKVKAGQLLAVIDNSYITEDFNRNRNSLESLRVREQRLLAEIRQQDFAKTDSMEEKLFEQELSAYLSRKSSLDKALNIAKTTKDQKTSMLAQLNTQISGLIKERSLGQKQVNIVQSLVSKGAVSSSNYLAAQAELQKTENALRNLQAQTATLNIEIAQADLNIVKIHDDYKAKSEEELLEVRSNINEALVKESTVANRKEQEQIYSPVDGTIQLLVKTNSGSVIPPGGEILTILPDNVPIVVVAKVKPEDRDKLWEGMDSKVRINSFGTNNNEILHGKVSVISSDSIEEREGRYYKIQIAVEQNTLGNKVYPGMSVNAYLTVGQRSVFQYLFKPLYSGFSTALQEP